MKEERMAAQVPAKTDERAVIYQAADGQEIKLTPEIVKKYLVQGKSELVTNQELMYFLNICKASKLNPLVKDCYLVKYSANEGAAIITSVDFFRKRARAQKDCKGWKKGVLVRDKDGRVRDSYGLVMDDETLVGGWFQAHPEGWLEPFRLEVNLKGYLKKTSEGKLTRFWAEENQPTMISKVAEAQGLRTLWPDEFQQLYEEAEGIQQGGNGGMPIIEISDEPAPDPDAFIKSIPTGTDVALLNSFIAATAAANKSTQEEVEADAVKDPKNFWKFYGAWAKQQAAKKQAGPPPKTQAEPDGTKVATPVDFSPPRYSCPNGGFVTTDICRTCKDRVVADQHCPADQNIYRDV
jgi:phage recombination protein Bet